MHPPHKVTIGQLDQKSGERRWSIEPFFPFVLTSAAFSTGQLCPSRRLLGRPHFGHGFIFYRDVDRLSKPDAAISVRNGLRQGSPFRVITIPPSALKKLQNHSETQDQYRAHFGDTYQGNFIFSNPDGSPLKPDTVSAAVSLLFGSLKLPKGASLHTLRHTHGSQLLAAGVPLTDVSKRLGHTNPHVTATIYGHAMPGHDDAAADAWEKFQKQGRPAKPARTRKTA